VGLIAAEALPGGKGVYREKAISESIGSDPIDEAMRVTSSAGWLQFGFLAILIAAAIVWSCLTDIPIKIKSKGMLLSEEGIAEVTLSSRGRVLEMNAHLGEFVKKGDLIALVGQPDLELQLSVREAQLRETRSRESSLLGFNVSVGTAQRAAVASRIHVAEQRVQILSERERVLQERDVNMQSLEQKGYVNKDTVLRNRTEMNNATDQLASARNEIALAQHDLQLNDVQRQKELSTVREDISRLVSEVEETQRLLTTNREVRSPYSGRVIEVKYSLGEFVETGSPIISLVRSARDNDVADGKLIAIAFVAPDQGKDIRPGMRVEIAPASVQANEYGFIVGRVKTVADAPATTAGMMRVLKNDQLVRQLSQNGAPFQIEVEMISGQTPSGYNWTSSNGPVATINSGTPCEAQFVTRERRLLGLVMPPFARLFPS
jgi:HlyD family secretion protein